MEYNKEKREIKSNRILSELDKFVLDFTRILEKYTEYIIISGYVSILLGRTRTTEDVDVFIKKMSFDKLLEFYNELRVNGFWCINADKVNEIYSYLNENLAVRFARGNQAVPNFEVKFTKRDVDEEAFNDFITVILRTGNLNISCLERHIAFKKYYLKTDKDIEDSKHIEDTFKGQIDYDKVNKLKVVIDKINEDERRNNYGN